MILSAALTGINLSTENNLPSGVQFVNAIPKDFPPLHADEARLHQILVNLLGNAMKFTTEGTITVSAAMQPAAPTPAATPSMAAISVIDTGVGIPEETQHRVW